MKSYPQLLQELKDSGMTEPDAVREIHKRHPGLRKAWELSQEKAKTGAPADPPEPAPAAGIDLTAIKRSFARYKPKPEKSEDEPRTPPAATGADQDYFGLIRRYRSQHKCDFQPAAQYVNKHHPGAWAEMLSKANGGADFSDRIKKK